MTKTKNLPSHHLFWLLLLQRYIVNYILIMI